MFTDPIKNLKAFGLRENDVVADLGAGTGYYSLFAGTLVPKGKVYAIEIDKNFLDTIKRKVKEANLKNVEIIWGNVETIGGTKIGDNVADAVIASNVLFQLENKDIFILEIKRILKPKGKVLLVDWRADSIVGRKMSVKKEKITEMFEKEGFVRDSEIDAGNHHYGMILRKSRE
ncbi:class I SAM-dependent methyltransferase [Candidatus Nomurabacteria bacterium]|nr:class I SAM-dependent methyltransferase [Candidatus Nomurabacteria bacterium]